MAHDPNEDFDHTVLDLIEHSPVGAVPVTPSYQDALRRLYGTHQVFVAADHPGGHVTARSLGRLPVFQAANLDEFGAGRIDATALEANGAVFDRYVQSLPAERRGAANARRLAVIGRPIHHRAKHAAAGVHDPVHCLFLVPGAGPNPGLPGNYLYGMLYETGTASTPWAVSVHDAGDGLCIYDAAGLSDAVAKVHEVIDSMPFDLRELSALGFRLV